MLSGLIAKGALYQLSFIATSVGRYREAQLFIKGKTGVKARDEFGPCQVRRTNSKPTLLSHLGSEMGSLWNEGAASVAYRA
jgi:hypothetical protein